MSHVLLQRIFIDVFDVFLLSYANDIAPLVTSAMHLKKFLKILRKYCVFNLFEVNSMKTEVFLIQRKTKKVSHKF